MSIAAQCPECCTCPEVTVEWDSRSASLTKCGWSEFAGFISTPPKIYFKLTRNRGFSISYAAATIFIVNAFGDVFEQEYYAGGPSRTCTSEHTYSATTCALTHARISINEDTPKVIGRLRNRGCGGSASDWGDVSQDSSGPDCLSQVTPNVPSVRPTPVSSTHANSDNTTVGPSELDGYDTLVEACAGGYGNGSTKGSITQTFTFNFTLSDEYTTTLLKTNTTAALPAWDDDWNDTAGSFANLTTDELSYAMREGRYRFRFRLPRVGNRAYRLSWIEQFIPAAGVGVSSVDVVTAGVYRPSVSTSPAAAGKAAASAVAVMAANGTVSGMGILNPGDYRPVATVSGGGGTGAAVVVESLNASNGQIDQITLYGGSGYTGTPTISFTNVEGAPRIRATATLTVDTNPSSPTYRQVTGINWTNRGDYRPRITFGTALSGGTTATATPIINTAGQLIGATISNAGNYLPQLAFSGGGGTGATATCTLDPQGGIAAVSLGAAGSGFTSVPAINVTSRASGFPAALLLVRIGTETPRCAVWDGTTLAGRWITRAFIAPDTSAPLSSIEVVHGGNYLPTVDITGGGGTGATAVVSGFSSDGKVTAITVTNAGTGYVVAPTVSIVRRGSGGTVTPATATASVSGGGVTGITITDQGSYLPTLTISGGGGSGATATVALNSSGAISTVTLTNPGSGFTSHPTLALSYYGTEEILLAAHFGVETEYADGAQPPTALPVGYVDGVTRTYPLIGNAGTAPWKYFEVPAPATSGTTLVVGLRSFCDGSACP